MAFDPSTWTLKTQEAANAAFDSARTSSNPEVTVDHLVAVLLRQEDGVVLPVLAKIGVAPLVLRIVQMKRCRSCPVPTAVIRVC